MSSDNLNLRMETPPGTGLGIDPADTDRYLDLAGKGLIVGDHGCNGPAVQDDMALDRSRTVTLPA